LVLFAQPHACAVLMTAGIAGKWEWCLSLGNSIMGAKPALFDNDESVSIPSCNIYNYVFG
jgi:hypothetical protein